MPSKAMKVMKAMKKMKKAMREMKKAMRELLLDQQLMRAQISTLVRHDLENEVALRVLREQLASLRDEGLEERLFGPPE